VSIDGVAVGRVISVRRDPQNRTVWVEATVDVAPPLPDKLVGYIRQSSLLGSGSNIVLEAAPDATGTLAAGAEIPLVYEGLQLLPPEFKAVGAELTSTLKQFREAKVVDRVNEQLERVGKTLDAAQLAITHADDYSRTSRSARA
jgi:ABC-type transporter Mla subunit MlaD